MVTMTSKKRRRLLWAISVTLAVGIAVSAVAGILLPLAVGDDAAAASRAGSGPSAAGMSRAETGPLTDYAVIYARRLRKPLYDTKLVAAPIKKPKPKLTVTLVGTAVEPGLTYGLFRTGRGRVKIVSVGQSIAGAKVTAISDGSATVEFNGEQVTLSVEKKGGGK